MRCTSPLPYQVPKEAYGDVLALIVKHLASETFVVGAAAAMLNIIAILCWPSMLTLVLLFDAQVHTYAACALDKFLTLPAPWQQVLKPQLPAVLAQLFKGGCSRYCDRAAPSSHLLRIRSRV